MHLGQSRTRRWGEQVNKQHERARRRAAGLLVPACLLAAGCGASSLSTPTTTLPVGTRVGPQVFLNDSASAATSIRTFVETLPTTGSTITDAQVRAMAPLLDAEFRQSQLELQRLSAMQVDDARLEQQRRAIVAPLGAAVVQMSAIAVAADAGKAAAVVAHLVPLQNALTRLGRAGS